MNDGTAGGIPTTMAEIGGTTTGTDCACTGAMPNAPHATRPKTRPTPQRRRVALNMKPILSRIPTNGRTRQHDHWCTGRAIEPPDSEPFDVSIRYVARLMRHEQCSAPPAGAAMAQLSPRNLIDDHGRGALIR